MLLSAKNIIHIIIFVYARVPQFQYTVLLQYIPIADRSIVYCCYTVCLSVIDMLFIYAVCIRLVKFLYQTPEVEIRIKNLFFFVIRSI